MARKISRSSERAAVRRLRHGHRIGLCLGVMLVALQSGASLAQAQERGADTAQPPAGVSDEASPAASPAPGGTVPDRLSLGQRAAGEPEEPWNRGVPMEERLKAREIYYEGNSYLRIPLFAQAAERYQEALTLYRHPAIYFNLALAQINLIQPVASHESFRRALAHGPAPIGEEHYRHGEEYLERLEQQLGHVEIVCDQDGAEVTLDGRPIFTGPGRFEGMVEPGEHQVLASKAGYLPTNERVVVSPGERTQVALRLRLPERTVTERYIPAWIPWAGLVAGAAALGAGAYYDRESARGLTAFDDHVAARCKRRCTSKDAPDLAPLLAGAKRERRVAQSLYIAGGVVAAGSAVLLYLNRERVVSRPVRERPVSLLPLMSPGMTGVVARGQF